MAAFTWGEAGAQMTPEDIAAQRKVAQAMMKRGGDYTPVQSWTQGLARVSEALMGGMMARDAKNASAANSAADKAMLEGWLSPAASTPATPSAIRGSVPKVSSAPQIVSPDQVNSIDAMADFKPETQGMLPRAQGAIAGIESGGRYDLLGPVTKTGDRAHGKYQVMGANIGPWTKEVLGQEMTPQQFLANPDAQDAVFNAKFGQKAEKFGPEGGARAWFAGEGGMNNPNAKDALGTTVAGYGSRFNAGMDDAALPPNARPAQAVTAPQPQSNGLQGVDPRLMQAIASPYASDGVKKIATLLLQQKLQGDAVTSVDLGNAVGIMDRRGNIIRQVPKGEPNKGPTYGVIGKDAFDREQYGWINPRDQSVTPFAAPTAAGGQNNPPTVTGVDGKPVQVPAGQNPKLFRDELTRATADAAAGKMTETQANATQFANRMEDAEKNLSAVEPDIAEGGWGVFKDRLARGVTEGQYNPIPSGATNFMVSDKYQRYEQGKSQFITGLLRKESGAAIAPSEFDRYDKEFFPQMGDSAQVIKQKQAARKVAIEAMKKGAGPSYKSPALAAPTGKTSSGLSWSVE